MSRKHFKSLAIALARSGASEAVIMEVAWVCKEYNSSFSILSFKKFIREQRALFHHLTSAA